MNCMNCGAPLTKSSYCPKCGFNVEIQKKVWHLSNMYYNLGLDKAQIRDLSGAIDLLKRSLKFNKLNIQARNLLGLVYFETGEAVAALSEWIISKNLMPEDNIASYYIDRLQENANKLDIINQTIKKYNDCLKCCYKGSEDVAVIQLRKILTQNPKLIKAYHLLALIYLKQEEYEKARKILKKAAKIDKTNSTTLRFLKEVDEQTGTMTSLEPRRWGLPVKQKEPAGTTQSVPYTPDGDLVIQPPTFRESSMAATLLNIGFGFLVGACLVWFLMVPANTQKINREANQKVVSYSNTMASQSVEMQKMQEQIQQSQETVSSAQEQIGQAEEKVTSYENLIKAYASFQEGNYTAATNVLQNVNGDLLSVDAKEIYNDIFSKMKGTILRETRLEGEVAFYSEKDYPKAIDAFKRALEMDESNYEIMNLLAHSYRLNQQFDEARAAFQKIVDTFPGTKRASNAQRYIDNPELLGDPNGNKKTTENSQNGQQSQDAQESQNGQQSQDAQESQNGQQSRDDQESQNNQESQNDREDRNDQKPQSGNNSGNVAGPQRMEPDPENP